VTPAYVDAMFERERSVSTYMGNYLAIPHGTNESKDTITRSALSVVRYDSPSTGTATRCASPSVSPGSRAGTWRSSTRSPSSSPTRRGAEADRRRHREEVYALLHAVNED
jgi:PTS system mannitol-specific IIA component